MAKAQEAAREAREKRKAERDAQRAREALASSAKKVEKLRRAIDRAGEDRVELSNVDAVLREALGVERAVRESELEALGVERPVRESELEAAERETAKLTINLVVRENMVAENDRRLAELEQEKQETAEVFWDGIGLLGTGGRSFQTVGFKMFPTVSVVKSEFRLCAVHVLTVSSPNRQSHAQCPVTIRTNPKPRC